MPVEHEIKVICRPEDQKFVFENDESAEELVDALKKAYPSGSIIRMEAATIKVIKGTTGT